MDTTQIIRATNRIALFFIGLLIYWIFIFISIQVFDFKVFRENITQSFFFSIVGIFAVLGGAVVVNIMFNLTKIADHIGKTETTPPKSIRTSKWRWGLIFASFPLLFGLLYLGDIQSSSKKRSALISSGESLIQQQQDLIEELARYEFSKDYVEKVSSLLKLLSRVDESFPRIALILRDTIEGRPILLEFGPVYYASEEDRMEKVDFIFSTSPEERTYLNRVFDGNTSEVKFSASDGNYELYYPIPTQHRIIVLYLSDRQRYGKIGS